MSDVVRGGLLLATFLLILLGSWTGRLENTVETWRELSIEVRIGMTILIGWPFIGYTTPVLLDIWLYVSGAVVGLGGDYLVTELQTTLLFILIAMNAIQALILVMKLKNIEGKV